MPIATQADLEAVRGPQYIDDLLRDAGDFGGSGTDAQKAARLSAALVAGDNLLRQFLVIEGLTPSDPRWETLRQFALEEALYYLQRHSSSGAAEADHTAAQMRRQDLGHMRRREQFAGTPENQRTATPTTVASSSAFSMDKLEGLI